MDYFKYRLYKTNIVHLYKHKNNFIIFLNVCDIYDADVKDAQTNVRNFKDNLNITACIFIASSIFIGYGIIFNLLLLELVLTLMRFSFELGKQHLINYKYVGVIKPYTLISAWNL